MPSDPLQDLHDHLSKIRPRLSGLSSRELAKLLKLHDALGDLLRARVNAGGVIEVLHYKDRQHDDYTRLFFETARQLFSGAEDFEVDHGTMVTGSDDAGEYILGFRWIANTDVVFPTWYDIEIGYINDDGSECVLGREHVLSYTFEEAKLQMIEQHWDTRLGAGGFFPYYKIYATDTLSQFEVTIWETAEDDEPIQHTVHAFDTTGALQMLKLLYPDLAAFWRVDFLQTESRKLVTIHGKGVA